MKIIGFENINGCQEMLLKGDSALLVNRKPFFIPEEATRIAAHPCLVLHICRLGKNISPRFAGRYFDAVACGLHIEDPDLLTSARENGNAWTIATASDGSSPVGEFRPVKEGEPLPTDITFSLSGEAHPFGRLLLSPEEAIAKISRHITIRQGDMIFITTDAQPFYPVEDQYISANIGEEENLFCRIK